jgi:hypothetical protein
VLCAVELCKGGREEMAIQFREYQADRSVREFVKTGLERGKLKNLHC